MYVYVCMCVLVYVCDSRMLNVSMDCECFLHAVENDVMYVCIYVCMHVCVYIYMYISKQEADMVWMHACVCVCMYASK